MGPSAPPRRVCACRGYVGSIGVVRVGVEPRVGGGSEEARAVRGCTRAPEESKTTGAERGGVGGRAAARERAARACVCVRARASAAADCDTRIYVCQQDFGSRPPRRRPHRHSGGGGRAGAGLKKPVEPSWRMQCSERDVCVSSPDSSRDTALSVFCPPPDDADSALCSSWGGGGGGSACEPQSPAPHTHLNHRAPPQIPRNPIHMPRHLFERAPPRPHAPLDVIMFAARRRSGTGAGAVRGRAGGGVAAWTQLLFAGACVEGCVLWRAMRLRAGRGQRGATACGGGAPACPAGW